MSYYGHLRKDSVAVSVGDFVKVGQAVGLLGNSGNSGGPHLHWGLYADALTERDLSSCSSIRVSSGPDK